MEEARKAHQATLTLKVGVIGFAEAPLMRALEKLTQAMPQVRLDMIPVDFTRGLSQVESGEIDCCMNCARTSIPHRWSIASCFAEN